MKIATLIRDNAIIETELEMCDILICIKTPKNPLAAYTFCIGETCYVEELYEGSVITDKFVAAEKFIKKYFIKRESI